jgi:hypothetical protein
MNPPGQIHLMYNNPDKNFIRADTIFRAPASLDPDLPFRQAFVSRRTIGPMIPERTFIV